MNLPVLPPARTVLYLGMGGGFDTLGAFPIAASLQAESVFASIGKDLHAPYVFPSSLGAATLTSELKQIVAHHQIDLVIAIDGGVDGLMFGDEVDSGTVLQDFITLAAVSKLNVPSVAAFVGFGCETDENLNHYRVLENIATLTKEGAFLGACALTPGKTFDHYRTEVFSSSHPRLSHIQTRIVASVEGHFGNAKIESDPNLSTVVFEQETSQFINPLMNLYWFFDLQGLVRNNRIIPHLHETQTMTEALRVYRAHVQRIRTHIPIPL